MPAIFATLFNFNFKFNWTELFPSGSANGCILLLQMINDYIMSCSFTSFVYLSGPIGKTSNSTLIKLLIFSAVIDKT